MQQQPLLDGAIPSRCRDTRFGICAVRGRSPGSVSGPGGRNDDRAHDQARAQPSGRALLLLLVPLAAVEVYAHLVWLGRIAQGFQPPVSAVEHVVYGSIVFYPILILIKMVVKALYYLVRAAFR